MNHEGVADAGVVGLPDDVDGELPLAFVVLKPECNVSAEEIITYINGEIVIIDVFHGDSFHFPNSGGVHCTSSLHSNSTLVQCPDAYCSRQIYY